MARIGQDLSNVSDEDMEGGSWRALPAGEYVAKVIDSDYKQTQNGKGWYLKLEFEVIEEPFAGRKLFDNLVLEHPNPDTVKIARSKLKQLAIAARHPNPDHVDDSDELHDLPLLVKLNRVVNKQYGDDEGYQNKVMAYRVVDTGARNSGSTRRAPAAEPMDEEPPF